MKSLDTLQSDIITWSLKANAKLSDAEVKSLYKACIREEYLEFLASDSPANEFSELMDLLWVIIVYCNAKGYSIPLGLDALVTANSTKLINPTYNENGKLLKGSNYVRPDWEMLLKESNMEK